jgi:hypothetical protein
MKSRVKGRSFYCLPVPGQVKIRASAEGFVDQEIAIDVSSGELKEIDIFLESESKRF